MKFQFQSDIHLEVGNQYNTYTITPKARYLILAGDVGNLNQYDAYVSFLRVQCRNFEKVFLGLGNHEFYNCTRTEGVELAERMTHEEGCEGKLFLLHRSRFDLDDDSDGNDDADGHAEEGSSGSSSKVTILGCTLNSRISHGNALMVRMKVHDFSKITDWTVEAHNAEHERDVTWLRDQLHDLRNSERKVLVVTHHAPFRHGCSKPQYETNDWHDAFATALLEPEHEQKPDQDDSTFRHDNNNNNTNNSDNEQPNILRRADVWIFGHTHYTTECKVGGVRCIANQRGYVFPWQRRPDSITEAQVHEPTTTTTTTPAEPTTTTSTNSSATASLSSSSWSKLKSKVFKQIRPAPKESSFKIHYPPPMQGHEGDGSIPFDPLRCIEI